MGVFALYEERLLERIGGLEKNPEERLGTNISRAVDSVIRHLQRMLNTRQGSVPIAEDYGISDMTNFPGEDLADTGNSISNIIRQFIAKYEPRLDMVHITFEPQEGSALSLRFKLEGRLVREDKRPIILETVVNSSGKVNVTD